MYNTTFIYTCKMALKNICRTYIYILKPTGKWNKGSPAGLGLHAGKVAFWGSEWLHRALGWGRT